MVATSNTTKRTREIEVKVEVTYLYDLETLVDIFEDVLSEEVENHLGEIPTYLTLDIENLLQPK